MTTPRPDMLDHVLAEIEELARAIRDEYWRAYHTGFEPARGGSAGRAGGVADPTGGATASLIAFRHFTTQAAKHSLLALNESRQAARELAKAFALIDRDEGEYTPSATTDLRPRTISHAELEQQRVLQRRRHTQGERWGNG